jgi:hypothetical protein
MDKEKMPSVSSLKVKSLFKDGFSSEEIK